MSRVFLDDDYCHRTKEKRFCVFVLKLPNHTQVRRLLTGGSVDVSWA
jgi:hypothetical protein